MTKGEERYMRDGAEAFHVRGLYGKYVAGLKKVEGISTPIIVMCWLAGI